MESVDYFSRTSIIFFSVLALFFLIGILVFRYNIRNKSERRIRKANAYVEALNELIAGNNERAKELFKEAVRFDTNNIDAYIKLGFLYRLSDNPEQALKIHKELTIRTRLKDNQFKDIYRNLVNDLFDLKQYDEALSYCEKLLSLDSKNRWALDFQPVIYEHKKDFKNAFKYLKVNADKSQNIDHQLALYKIAHGRILVERGEYHDARLVFKEAIKLDRSFPAAYLYLGDAYAKEDRQDDAVKVWREFAEVIPKKSFLVFDFLDTAYFESGNYAAMEEFYSDIIENDNDNYQALLKLGEIYFKKGDKDKAMEMTERSFRINPHSPHGLKNLIMYLDKSDDIQVIKDKALSLAEMISNSPSYKCRFCNKSVSEILIQCPSCGKWDAFEL